MTTQGSFITQYDITKVDTEPLYRKVLLWIAAQFGIMVLSMLVLGPIIPQGVVMALYLVLLASMIVAAFVRKVRGLSSIFAVVVPAILGIALYGTLNYYISAGAGDIVLAAAGGTAVVFGIMAVWGYTSRKSLDSWANKLFFILLGVIAVSLLNAFVFHLTALSLLISIASVVIFSIYTFIDIQAVRKDGAKGEASRQPASYYALNIFLDIYNLFVSLLNILSVFRN